MDYVTVAQAAAELGLTPRGLRNRIERGDVQAEKVAPRLLMISRAEVERWRGVPVKRGRKPQKKEVPSDRTA